jgi:hypothetical protein
VKNHSRSCFLPRCPRPPIETVFGELTTHFPDPKAPRMSVMGKIARERHALVDCATPRTEFACTMTPLAEVMQPFRSRQLGRHVNSKQTGSAGRSGLLGVPLESFASGGGVRGAPARFGFRGSDRVPTAGEFK